MCFPYLFAFFAVITICVCPCRELVGGNLPPHAFFFTFFAFFAVIDICVCTCREPVQDNFPLHAAFVLAKHELTPMDIVAIDTSSQKRLYSMLSVTWGIMADVDIESERYRYMGHARFTVGAIVRMVSKYHW